MKVKVNHKNLPYSTEGQVIEVSEGHAKYMVEHGQGEIIEGDSDVAHDMGSIPIAATNEKPAVIPPKLKKKRK